MFQKNITDALTQWLQYDRVLHAIVIDVLRPNYTHPKCI